MAWAMAYGPWPMAIGQAEQLLDWLRLFLVKWCFFLVHEAGVGKILVKMGGVGKPLVKAVFFLVNGLVPPGELGEILVKGLVPSGGWVKS